MGGLGNQLFIMARTFSLAKQTGRQAVIHKPSIIHTPHSSQHYEETVFKDYQTIDFEPTFTYREPVESCLLFCDTTKLVPITTKHAHLTGYFQHPAYVDRDFVSTLSLPAVPLLQDTIFVHVRRGDYLDPDHNIHNINLTSPDNSYYPLAMNLARDFYSRRGKTVRFLVFSNDVVWCRTAWFFNSSDVSIFESDNEVLTLATMAACELGGIGANSSLSWWAAYLQKSLSNLVIFPHTWFSNDWKVDIWPSGSFKVSGTSSATEYVMSTSPSSYC